MSRAAREDDAAGPTTVLFVCTGNICRSPMAEVVLRSLCARAERPDVGPLGPRVEVTSAGTARWHEGEAMDPRARAALDAAGYVLGGTPARQVTDEELVRHDLVVALDRGHRAELARRADREVSVLRWWSEGLDLDVPDPFYGDDEDFVEVLGLIVPACAALAAALGAAAGSGREDLGYVREDGAGQGGPVV